MKTTGNTIKKLFPPLLFSGLGVFSYYLLITLGQFPIEFIPKLTTPLAYIFAVCAFNLLGYVIINFPYRMWKYRLPIIYSIAAITLFAINYAILVCAKLLIGAENPLIFPNGGTRILIAVWLIELIVIGLLLANRSIAHSVELQKETTRLQKENDMAQYAALQNQLNPHFLFNSLNTLISEIEFDPQNATVFARKLSDVYRYVLQMQSKLLVPLREELSFAESYIFLHQVRLGNNIHYNTEIADLYLDAEIPPLTLQLLIENAIKHNIITASKPITINVRIEGQMLTVSNTFQPKILETGIGTGLKNLHERCIMMFGKAISIEHIDDEFMVRIPIAYE